jgi:hypothetical protein
MNADGRKSQLFLLDEPSRPLGRELPLAASGVLRVVLRAFYRLAA